MADLPNPSGEDDVTNGTRTQQRTWIDITELRPFRVEIGGSAIDELRDRIARTRSPEKEPPSARGGT
jgi:hypothetical protein